MRTTKALYAVALAGLLSACGSNGFSGGTSSGGSGGSTADSNTGAPGAGAGTGSAGGGSNAAIREPGGDNPEDVDGGSVVIGEPTEDESKALAACSKAWGQEIPGDLSSVRKIAANVSVLGASTMVDNRKTEGPEVTMILASVNVLSKIDWQLLNPNGWYCIVANVNVLSKLTVTIDKDAHLADSKVAVGVLSSSNGEVGAANVNVLSNVEVIKQ